MILMKAMKRNQINEFQLKSIKIDENLEMLKETYHQETKRERENVWQMELKNR